MAKVKLTAETDWHHYTILNDKNIMMFNLTQCKVCHCIFRADSCFGNENDLAILKKCFSIEVKELPKKTHCDCGLYERASHTILD